MTDQIENLLLEHMKRFQAGQERMERKLDGLVTHKGHVEQGLSGLRRDFAHADENTASMGVRLDRLNERIERIEKRLELA